MFPTLGKSRFQPIRTELPRRETLGSEGDVRLCSLRELIELNIAGEQLVLRFGAFRHLFTGLEDIECRRLSVFLDEDTDEVGHLFRIFGNTEETEECGARLGGLPAQIGVKVVFLPA